MPEEQDHVDEVMSTSPSLQVGKDDLAHFRYQHFATCQTSTRPIASSHYLLICSVSHGPGKPPKSPPIHLETIMCKNAGFPVSPSLPPMLWHSRGDLPPLTSITTRFYKFWTLAERKGSRALLMLAYFQLDITQGEDFRTRRKCGPTSQIFWPIVVTGNILLPLLDKDIAKATISENAELSTPTSCLE